MIVFGLAGTNGSGKDTIAEMLEEEYGFLNASATKMLSDELTRRGQGQSRKDKSGLSAEWRRQHGMAAIVDKAVEEFNKNPEKYKGLIVGSLRHPGETDRVHELGGLQIWVDADPKIRYERVISANRGRPEEDDKTFEEFLADQKREMTPVGDEATLNMAGVKDKADIFIENNGNDLEEFKNQVIKALKEYL